MASLKKYDLSGKEVGHVVVEEEFMRSSANAQMVKDYIVALRENARQWSASTKNRAEVNHSGQKPHPQKGTGKARQGYLGAPQYKGGGRVHTPRPKFDQYVKMNRKEKQAVIGQLIAERVVENRIHVLQFEGMKAPKTKTVVEFLKAVGLGDKKVLFVGEGFFQGCAPCGEVISPMAKFENFSKSLRNLPKQRFALISNLNGYDILLHQDIVVMDTAVDQLKVLLAGRS